MTATSLRIVIAALLLGRPAFAQESSPRDPIAAEALFERGKQLMDQGRTVEACAVLGESQRLDPAGGTLLRLALCHEAAGKLASAWLEFLEVVRVSQEGTGETAKLQERVRLAREHLAAIEPRVPKLAIGVAPGVRIEGLRVSANGLPRNEGAWGVPLPVDPGEVVVVASAPGRREFKTTMRLAEGQQQTLDVPPLLPLPAVRAPVLVPAPPPPAHASIARPIGLGVGALGIAAVGVGTYFGFHAISQWNASNAKCPGTSCADPSGVTLASDAKSAARIADVTLAAGAVALVAGVVLYLVGAPVVAERTGATDGLTLSF